MPRIKAATVPEHRDAQRARLLAAARELVLAGGPAALRFGPLADRAGVARPSVYDYFPTRAALLIALVDEELPAWRAELAAAMARATCAKDRVRAFVRTQLRLVAQGRHELPFALVRGELEPEVQAHVAQAHAGLFGSLHAALAELGVKDPAAGAALIAGAVRSAVESLRGGAASAAVIRATVAFVVGGVEALAGGAGVVRR